MTHRTDATMVWVHDENGSGLHADGAARVSVLDHGFTVADGVFETLKVERGMVFALQRHLSRLQRSSAAMGLPEPDLSAIESAVEATVAANTTYIGDHARLRITYTGGLGPLGSDRLRGVPTWVVAVAPTRPWPVTAILHTVAWPLNERGPLVGIKSTSYAENVMALADAHAHGADEALWLNTRGELCEGSGSNIFVVTSGRVFTPELRSGCLGGITRELLLEWCTISEVALTKADLIAADEVFITSSTRDVQPVSVVDGRKLPAPGPMTTTVQAEFAHRAGLEPNP